MAKKVPTQSDQEPSISEVAEVLQQSLNELKQSIEEKLNNLSSNTDDQLSLIRMEFDEKLKDAKPPETEEFIKSAKVAGSLERVEIFKLIFGATLQGLISNPNSQLYKMSNTDAARENRKLEVNKLFELTDIISLGLEAYFEE